MKEYIIPKDDIHFVYRFLSIKKSCFFIIRLYNQNIIIGIKRSVIMKKTIFSFKVKHVVECINFSLISIIMFFYTIKLIAEHGFFIEILALIGFVFLMIKLSVINNVIYTLDVFEDYIKVRNVTCKKDIFFTDIHMIRYEKKNPERLHVVIRTKDYIILENKKGEELYRINTSLFKTKKNAVKFLDFIHQNQTHISFDSHIHNILQGTLQIQKANVLHDYYLLIIFAPICIGIFIKLFSYITFI